jgi:uncharacterized protein YecE (DUF72 family)
MLYIGTSGWYYADWRGIVYPGRDRHDPLTFLTQFFNALEINVTFYRDVSTRMAASWLRRVQHLKDFQFTAKLHQRFTHQRREPALATAVRASLQGLEPLREAGRLGALLAQFPWSVRAGEQQRDWMQRLCQACEGYSLVVEFRHDSWLRDDSLDLLRALGVGFCNIDQPAYDHCIPPTEHVTSPVAYVRLHGRNYARWWNHEDRNQRYDYLYTGSELDPWVDRVRRITQQAARTFVFTNNHFRGQAPANALEMKAKIHGEPIDIPPSMLREFPELRNYARPAVEQQGELFG